MIFSQRLTIQLKKKPNSFNKYHNTQGKHWLDKEKTKKFMNLVKIMANDLGGLMKAYEKIGLCPTLQTNLYEGKITIDTANIILKKYKKHKNEMAKQTQ